MGYTVLFNAFLGTYEERLVFEHWELLGDVSQRLDSKAPYYFLEPYPAQEGLIAPRS